MTDRKRGLGRGLSALMADIEQPASDAPTSVPQPPRPDTHLPIERVHPNPDQPRMHFGREQLDELAASIREHGIIQPLIVREAPDGDGYQIVAGERRWRAAQMAQLHEVPVVIRNFDDTEVLQVAIIENIQRADLDPLEEARGFQQLMDRFGHTQEKLAEALGKSRSHIANMLRLLTLPDAVQEMLRDGKLTPGHARALITASDPEAMARQVVDKGLSVRETERLAKGAPGGASGGAAAPRPRSPEKDPDTKALEGDLSAALKMRVSVDHAPGNDGGTISIRYKDLDQLDDLCRLLAG
ncbi:MAG: ParB/RepB/Spo0J family partition protein [Shimia sp.]